MQRQVITHRNGRRFLIVRDMPTPIDLERIASDTELQNQEVIAVQSLEVFDLLANSGFDGYGFMAGFFDPFGSQARIEQNRTILYPLIAQRYGIEPSEESDDILARYAQNLLQPTSPYRLIELTPVEALPSRIGEVLQWIREHPADSLSLAGIADPTGLTNLGASAGYFLEGRVFDGFFELAMFFVPAGIEAAFKGGRTASTVARHLDDIPPNAGHQLPHPDVPALEPPARMADDILPGGLPARGEHLTPDGGNWTNVWRSADGTQVIKEINETIEGNVLTPTMRAGLARRTVDGLDALRDAGFPIPHSYIPDGNPYTIVQDIAPGIPLERLPVELQEQAWQNAIRMEDEARAAIGNRFNIDSNPSNFHFNEDGTVRSWFDPIRPDDAAGYHRSVIPEDWNEGFNDF